MATFHGTAADETITPSFVSATVTATPPGSLPSDADDSLFGEGGNDILAGGGGNDYLHGGPGNDTMAGGAGNDTYIVGSAGDVITELAGEGTDTVLAYTSYTLPVHVENLSLLGSAWRGIGNELDNVISGNAGDNYLYGLEGRDTLYGNAGNDILHGGPGNDTMAGGPGNDTYVIGSTFDVVIEAAGEGTDTVQAYDNYTLPDNVENLCFVYGTATSGTGNNLDNIIWGNSRDNLLSGLSGNDTLYGYDGHDFLNGGPGNDTMVGGAGNDTYVVDSSSDTVIEAAGEGSDTINAEVSYTLPVNVENLYLLLSAGQITALDGTGNSLNNGIYGNGWGNTLSGLEGDDFLYGYGGNDFLHGGPGNDTMVGGRGDDTYVVGNLGDMVIEAANEGTNDRVDAYLNYTLGAHVENLYLYGGASHGTGNELNNQIFGNARDNFLSGLAGDDKIYGYEGSDFLDGSDGNDTLDGGPGNDTMAGGAGNDQYYVDAVGDTVIEEFRNGTDTVHAYLNYTLGSNVECLYLYDSALNGIGNELNNLICGNANNNTLSGLGGNDQLEGYDGNDNLIGGAGNDILQGGPGDDTMTGGPGDDGYYVDSPADTVIEAAGEGYDRVYALINYTLGDHVERLELRSPALTGTGNSLDNEISGNHRKNVLFGLDGNDKLDGKESNDTLYGGNGNDILIGGTDRDSFVFAESGPSHYDAIKDFSHAYDTIVLTDLLDGVTDAQIKGLNFDAGKVLDAGSYFEGPNKTGNGTTDPSGIYNDTATGTIWYNPTSDVASDSVQICTVGVATAPTLDHTDFVYAD